jgi:hypothetical protein
MAILGRNSPLAAGKGGIGWFCSELTPDFQEFAKLSNSTAKMAMLTVLPRKKRWIPGDSNHII